jgi:pimeloyl-ACP methyl ester carboxylesterase
MPTIWKTKDSAAPARTLVVFLPGRHDTSEDFLKYGFIDSLWEAGIEADVVLPDAHLGYYYKRSFPKRFREDVIEPAIAKGYQRIWAVGISLGSFGALMFERDYPGTWEGVVLLAPFTGDDPAVLQRVHKAPSLAEVDFGNDATDDDYTEQFWAWLQAYQDSAGFPIFLGYGDQDRMRREHEVISSILPDSAVFTTSGKHVWPVWKGLWREMLPSLPIE